MLKAFEHGDHLLELSPRGVHMVVERPKSSVSRPLAVERIAQCDIGPHDRAVIVLIGLFTNHS